MVENLIVSESRLRKTGFLSREGELPSSRDKFQQLLKAGFVLEKRFEKEEDKFDVNCLLSVLKKHRLFGKSFKQDLAKLYDDLKEAYFTVKEIHALRAGGKPKYLTKLSKEIQLLADYQRDIIDQEDKILTDLELGYHELRELAKRVELLKSDEKQILDWVKEIWSNNPAIIGVLRRPMADIATEIQGALHKIYPLFDVVSKAYDEQLLKRVKDKISDEVNKLDMFLKQDIEAVKQGKAEPVPEISFEKVLADIALIQGTVDDIIKDVQNIKNRDHAFCSRMSKDMKNISKIMMALLKHPEFEAFQERKEAWRAKNLRN